MAHIAQYSKNYIEDVHDSKFISRPANDLIPCYEPQYAGLYLYGSVGTPEISPNNDTNNGVYNTTVVGINPDNIFADRPPYWVGFLSYVSNDPVHFNDYLGYNNNGSRHSILSRDLTRTNKHFLYYYGGLSNAFNYCGQYFDPGLNYGSARVAKAVIIFGSHPEIPNSNITFGVWLITKVNNALVFENITEQLRVAFGLATVQQVEDILDKNGDDMYFIPSTPYPTTLNYPHVLSENAYYGLLDLDSDFFTYLTRYNIDQNNYIRLSDRMFQPLLNHCGEVLPYITKDNFKKLIIDNIDPSYCSAFLSTDTDDEKFKKFISLTVHGGPVVGDSSSSSFIRESELGIDIFCSGTMVGFFENRPIIGKLNNQLDSSTNYVNTFFDFIEDRFGSFERPSVIEKDSEIYNKLIDIWYDRKQALSSAILQKPSNRETSSISSLSQVITVDPDANINMSGLFSSGKTTNTQYKQMLPSISSTDISAYKKISMHGNQYEAYPLSIANGVVSTSVSGLSGMIKSFEIIDKNIKLKVNTDIVTHVVSRHHIILTDYNNIYIGPEYIDKLEYLENDAPEGSMLRKLINKNNGVPFIVPTEFQYKIEKKSLAGTLTPFNRYRICYNIAGPGQGNNQGSYLFANNVDNPYWQNGLFDPGDPWSIIRLYDFYYNSSYNRYIDYITYDAPSSTTTIDMVRAASSLFIFDLTKLQQGESLVISVKNPYSSIDDYFKTEIIKTNKNNGNTIDVSSYSTKPNTKQYYKNVLSPLTFQETFEYIPTDCTQFASFGDFDNNGKVDAQDLAALLSVWGPTETASIYDINGDNRVGAEDLVIVLNNWGNLDDVLQGQSTACNNGDPILITTTYPIPLLDVIPIIPEEDSNGEPIVTIPDLIIKFPLQISANGENIIIES